MNVTTETRAPYFMVAKPYTTTAIAETKTLADAARIATSLSMYYGLGVEVSRMVPEPDRVVPKRTSLLMFAPTSIDWRQVSPEHALLVKSLSFDLEPLVHTLLENEREGETA